MIPRIFHPSLEPGCHRLALVSMLIDVDSGHVSPLARESFWAWI